MVKNIKQILQLKYLEYFYKLTDENHFDAENFITEIAKFHEFIDLAKKLGYNFPYLYIIKGSSVFFE